MNFVSWQPSYNCWGKQLEDSKEIERKYEEEVLPMYLAMHHDISEEISQNLKLMRAIKGMDKEQVRLILHEPEEVTKDELGREVWWYYKNRPSDCFLQLLTQPVLLPFVLVSPAFYAVWRKEIYWHEDRVEDLQEHRATGPLMALP